jgi:hypothetical protein
MKLKEIIKELNKYKHNDKGQDIFVFIGKEDLVIKREITERDKEIFLNRVKELI